MRRRPLIVLASIVIVLALVAAGAAAGVALVSRAAAPSSSDAAASWPAPDPIRWGACSNGSLKAVDAQCAMVRVPMDWSAPRNGTTIRLAVSRVRHTASPYEGVMLTNPGGPGGSGLTLSTVGASVPGGVGARYDWIGFDPRGVGDSRPALTCQEDYANGPRPAYRPATAARIAAWRARSEAYAKACAKNGALLDHMTSRDAATDMDYLRLALGAQTISFYGFSYGSYLGQLYATLFPTHLRRMVLDSTVDPTRVWYDANLDQDTAFQVAFDAWFAWIAKYDATYHLGSTAAAVADRYRAVADRLAQQPAGGVLGSAEWDDAFIQAAYGQHSWPGLTTAFAEADRGDTAKAIQYWRAFNDPHDDNGFAVYLAVQCTDVAWPTDWATWSADTRRIAKQAPDATWLNLWFNAPCRTWPAKAQRPVTVDGSAAPPILMIDETLDAATPYSGSLTVRGLFPKAVLLAEPGGTSHADSLSGNACVDDTIATYLGSGELPARVAGKGPDTTCAPLPTPKP